MSAARIEWQWRKISVLRRRRCFFYATKMISTVLQRATRNGSPMITGDDRLRSWTMMKFRSTPERQNCSKRRSCWPFCGLQLAWFITASWIRIKRLRRSASSKLKNRPGTSPTVIRIGQEKDTVEIERPGLPHSPCSLDLLTITLSIP